MAAREGDVALWLHNKLGSTDDLWSGSSICSQLSREKLSLIQDCFHNLQPHVKVKLLLSLLHIPKRNIEEWKLELDVLIQMASDDTDQWVTMVAEILKNFPGGGALSTDIAEHQSSFHDIVNDLRKLVRRTQDSRMTPLECSYLSRNGQVSVTGQLPQPVKHFALKRKPKSAALRAEILQKSAEAANNLKKNKSKSAGVTIPVKIRSFAKKLDDSGPMRGIPNNQPTSSGFIRANPLGSRFGGSGVLGQRSQPNRREGGIKLLDISDCPVGAKETKRRKKEAEQKALEAQKKEKEAQANTPDYAAGLVNPAGLGGVEIAAGPSYVPAGVTRIADASALPGGVSNATQQARDNLQQQLNQQLTTTTTTIIHPTILHPAPTQPPGVSVVTINNPALPTTQPIQQQQQQRVVTMVTPGSIATTQSIIAPVTQQPGAAVVGGTTAIQIVTQGTVPAQTAEQAQGKKGLSLTREQMYAAQEMFRTSNKVTRPEKALILGFMAGSRDNPCPSQGNIVNIRLGEEQDSIKQPDGLFKPMMVDSYIQMDYATGDWKRIKKYREVDVGEV